MLKSHYRGSEVKEGFDPNLFSSRRQVAYSYIDLADCTDSRLMMVMEDRSGLSKGLHSPDQSA